MDDRLTYSSLQSIGSNNFSDNNYRTNDTLPSIVNNTPKNNIIDIISDAMNEVKIGIENKLVKKNTTRQSSIWKHKSDSIEV
jgi:hypothetical protein